MAGLTAVQPKTASTADYDELVGMHPGLAPMHADEAPTEEETMHFNELFSDFMEQLFGNSKEAAKKMLTSAPVLYQGVAKVAFTVLKASHDKYVQQEGVELGAVLFGQGGMIATAVDEVYKLAVAIKIPGVEDEQQYSAAQFEVMRLVGEYMQKSQDDESVDGAQELLLDIEEAGGGLDASTPVSSEDRDTLAAGAAPPPPPLPPEVSPEAAAAVPEGGMPIEEELPVDPAAPPAVPPQGLV